MLEIAEAYAKDYAKSHDLEYAGTITRDEQNKKSLERRWTTTPEESDLFPSGRSSEEKGSWEIRHDIECTDHS